ncbi:MAG: tRNA pseudouridine(38-40) synthase TruA [Clostridia bacterium]
MKRILLTIQYDGTNFCGWQAQPGQRSVQKEIENQLEKIFEQKVELFASGRTDAGVHAKNQFAHFDYDGKFEITHICNALASYLPEDISVTCAKEVLPNFHARFCVKQKIYRYICYVSEFKDVFLNKFALQIKKMPNVQKIRQSAKYFIGTHDFSAFCASGSNILDHVRTIYNIKILENCNQIIFEFSGNGFLYNMVRIIVGTLLDVGCGKIQVEKIPEIIESKQRHNAGKTVQAHGLCLYDVVY